MPRSGSTTPVSCWRGYQNGARFKRNEKRKRPTYCSQLLCVKNELLIVGKAQHSHLQAQAFRDDSSLRDAEVGEVSGKGSRKFWLSNTYVTLPTYFHCRHTSSEIRTLMLQILIYYNSDYLNYDITVFSLSKYSVIELQYMILQMNRNIPTRQIAISATQSSNSN